MMRIDTVTMCWSNYMFRREKAIKKQKQKTNQVHERQMENRKWRISLSRIELITQTQGIIKRTFPGLVTFPKIVRKDRCLRAKEVSIPGMLLKRRNSC